MKCKCLYILSELMKEKDMEYKKLWIQAKILYEYIMYCWAWQLVLRSTCAESFFTEMDS